ncbi:MAG: ATP-binding cassette domain-containing protein, partial [Methanobrevibacter sp.]|nr:ATP-binding cassette domain-containing protein [Methanobrevibacter sp.]
KKPNVEVERVLRLVSMSGTASRKFGQCSLGMKQRIGVAQSLLGNPKLLILDEPINGLDADGMRIVRETLIEINKTQGVTILISSHILGELSKVATHYGIIRQGTLIKEMTAKTMSEECKDFVFVKASDEQRAFSSLKEKYSEIELKDGGIRVYDEENSEITAKYLFDNGIFIKEIIYNKIGLEEYYIKIMSKKENI